MSTNEQTIQASTEAEAAQSALETLQKRRGEIENELESARTDFEQTRTSVVDGSATTAQLSKKRTEVETLESVLNDVDAKIEAAQWTLNNVLADERQDTANQTLRTASAQRTFLLSERAEVVARVAEQLNAGLLEIAAIDVEISNCTNDAQSAFNVLCPGVTNQTYFSVLPADVRARLHTILTELRADGGDPKVLAGGNYRSWLNDHLKFTPHPSIGLPPALEAARATSDGRTPPDHGDAHIAAVSIGGPLTPPNAAKPTGPIFAPNGERDYVAESQANGGRVAST